MPKSRGEMKHLFLHHKKLWLRWGVPRDCREAFDGKTAVLVPLGDNLAAARRHRDVLIPQLKEKVEQVRSGKREGDHFMLEAAKLRATYEQALKDGEGPYVEEYAATRAEEIRQIGGDGHHYHPKWEQKSMLFHDAALGRVTLVSSALEQFKREQPVSASSERKRGLVFRRLFEFDSAVTFQMPRTEAGRFMTWMLDQGLKPRSANEHLWPLSTCWKWAIRKGYATENVWLEQNLSTKRDPRQKKRGYTDDEIRCTLEATRSVVRDTYLILFSTGMRISEVASLTPGDVVGGWFYIREGKTASATRKVYIHPRLEPILAERQRDFIM